MSSCSPAARDKCRAALARLGAHPDVLSTDLIAPDVDPHNEWTIEIAIDPDNGLRPGIVRELADEGLTIQEAAPRQRVFRVIATA